MSFDIMLKAFANIVNTKTALILTWICKKSIENKGEGIKSSAIKRKFSYLSQNEIRSALLLLRKRELVNIIKSQGEFTRELLYFPSEKSINRYKTEFQMSILGTNT